jgi:hypothetical protein
MDKLEISEQMTKAIVEHLVRHKLFTSYTPQKEEYLSSHIHVPRKTLELYVREAILEHLKKEELELIKEYFDKERE